MEEEEDESVKHSRYWSVLLGRFVQGARDPCSCTNKPTRFKLAACNVVGSVISVALGQNHIDQCGSTLMRLPGRGLGTIMLDRIGSGFIISTA